MMDAIRQKCECCGKQTMGEWDEDGNFVIRHGGHIKTIRATDFMRHASGKTIDALPNGVYSTGDVKR